MSARAFLLDAYGNATFLSEEALCELTAKACFPDGSESELQVTGGHRQLATTLPLSQIVTSPGNVPSPICSQTHWHDEPVEFTSSGTLVTGN